MVASETRSSTRKVRCRAFSSDAPRTRQKRRTHLSAAVCAMSDRAASSALNAVWRVQRRRAMRRQRSCSTRRSASPCSCQRRDRRHQASATRAFRFAAGRHFASPTLRASAPCIRCTCASLTQSWSERLIAEHLWAPRAVPGVATDVL
eukprot:395406-Prymnesium_polylepis.1